MACSRAGAVEPRGVCVTMVTLAAVAHSGTALWYLTRATGLISLILLSATVVLGIVASVGWTAARWPRFLSQAVHRNLSLFCIALIAIHIVTTVADGYVPISYWTRSYRSSRHIRPLWIGLGALAFDMLLAVGITSGLRRRIGVRAWRGVHYLAYACWPIAVVHGLGSGSDARLPIMMLIEVVCIAAVVSAVAWRLVAARRLHVLPAPGRGRCDSGAGDRHRRLRLGRPPPARMVTTSGHLGRRIGPDQRSIRRHHRRK